VKQAKASNPKNHMSLNQTRRLAALVLASLMLVACLPVRPPPPAQPTSEPNPIGAKNVELYVLPDDDEIQLLNRIGSAKRRVYMKMYLLTETRIIDALKRAKANGAEVRAMIEERPFGGGTAAQTAFNRLREAGINTKTTNPTFRLSHEKSFIIDDVAVISTANMTRSSFSRNREFMVLIDNIIDVAELVTCFDADWNRQKFAPRSQNLVWSPVNARERINDLINSADDTLLVYAASSSDDEQTSLIAAAKKRGVDVRVLTSPPRPDETDDPDAGNLDKMQRAKVKVRNLKSPFVHAKMFLADDKLAYVGSVNISTASLNFNRELGILVSDPNALRRIRATFEQDWDKATDR
jgi:phosphatidylserine/phosphatidylglycerophosphate/cardiolipin synthase-like enzyme